MKGLGSAAAMAALLAAVLLSDRAIADASAGAGAATPSPTGGASGDAGPAFVGREACAGCHGAEAKAWTGSHHDLAMQEAREDTVLGDFADVTVEHEGKSVSFFKRGTDFYVRAEGPDGTIHDYRVSHTFGVAPLQQYLVPFPGEATKRLRGPATFPKHIVDPSMTALIDLSHLHPYSHTPSVLVLT